MQFNIDSKTKICGSIARSASNLGAKMYNSAYRELDLNFIYIPFATVDTENAIDAMRALSFQGLAAAEPHNISVKPFIDYIDETASTIGAINTILNDKGVLKGFNSDWIGFKNAFEEVESLKNRKVVVVGAGGACRAIVYALINSNVNRIVIINRTEHKAKAIANNYGIESGSLDSIFDLIGFDTLINTTSVGSYSNKTKELEIFNGEIIKKFDIVFDVVFSPIKTPLMNTASLFGIKVVPGWRMLLHQGSFQFNLFTNKLAPIKLLSDILYNCLKDR